MLARAFVDRSLVVWTTWATSSKRSLRVISLSAATISLIRAVMRRE